MIKHDVKGFQQIKALHDEMKEKVQEEVCIVFEATGVYHRGLQKYLDQNGMTIAKIYYNYELNDSHRIEDIYYSLQQMSRHYETLLAHLRKCKVRLNEVLVVVFPDFNAFFSDLYSDLSLAI